MKETLENFIYYRILESREVFQIESYDFYMNDIFNYKTYFKPEFF